VVAFRLMHDIGFERKRGGRPLAEMRGIASASIEHGWRVPAVKCLMVQSLFTGGVGIYAFYALQPYLLELYGDPNAYQIAGLVAAIVAGAEILGGLAAPRVRRLFQRRTWALLATASLSAIALAMIGLAESFAAVIALTVAWGLLFAATTPIRQAYLNALIPSQQRATILSFDSLMGSSGGVWAQPVLGRTADASGYATSYLVAAGGHARSGRTGGRAARLSPADSRPPSPQRLRGGSPIRSRDADDVHAGGRGCVRSARTRSPPHLHRRRRTRADRLLRQRDRRWHPDLRHLRAPGVMQDRAPDRAADAVTLRDRHVHGPRLHVLRRRGDRRADACAVLEGESERRALPDGPLRLRQLTVREITSA
jgi:Major Facilitator Superfamily